MPEDAQQRWQAATKAITGRKKTMAWLQGNDGNHGISLDDIGPGYPVLDAANAFATTVANPYHTQRTTSTGSIATTQFGGSVSVPWGEGGAGNGVVTGGSTGIDTDASTHTVTGAKSSKNIGGNRNILIFGVGLFLVVRPYPGTQNYQPPLYSHYELECGGAYHHVI